MQPKVSVIIPAYNVGDYLDACLASLSAQTFGDFEAVVVNDGSSDDTEAVALRHAAADPRIRVISTPNGGAAARSCGGKSRPLERESCLSDR